MIDYFTIFIMGCMAIFFGVLSFYALNSILITTFVVAFHLITGCLFFLVEAK